MRAARHWHNVLFKSTVLLFATVVVVCLVVLVRLYLLREALAPGSKLVPEDLPKDSLSCIAVYGTRPELVKMMPIIRALRETPNSPCRHLAVVTTGQHQDLIHPLEQYFGLIPDVSFEIMRKGQDLQTLFRRASDVMGTLFKEAKPSVVIVQGDTTTAMAAAVQGFHAGVHVVHVEAGLRTYDLAAPFPEEFNRRTIGILCTICLAPTKFAETALLNEGLPSDRVYMVGNSVVDQLQHSLLNAPEEIVKNGGAVELASLVAREDGQNSIVLKDTTQALLSRDRHVVLITAHRRENALSGAFERIGAAVARLAKAFPSATFIVPLHSSPAVRDVFIPLWRSFSNIYLVNPPPYPVFVQLFSKVTLILTDSGGIQEEAISMHLPVLVMRTRTERMEGVLAGGARLVGDTEESIFSSTARLILHRDAYNKMAHAENPYGEGTTGVRTVGILQEMKKSILENPPQSLIKFVPRTEIRGGEEGGEESLFDTGVNAVLAQRPPKVSVKNVVDPVNSELGVSLKANPMSITVILTGYKRSPEQLGRQINALLESEHRPEEIMFFQNESHQDFRETLSQYPEVKHIYSRNFNTKFHGRFTAALLATTEYVAVVDDESVPGPKYIRHAIEQVDKLRAFVGITGRNLRTSILHGIYKESVLDAHHGEGYNKCDFMGHWWMWKSEWTRGMFSMPSFSLWTAEDMEFSAKLKILYDVQAVTLNYVDLDHRGEDHDLHVAVQGGVASYLIPGTKNERGAIAQEWIKMGWPMQEVATEAEGTVKRETKLETVQGPPLQQAFARLRNERFGRPFKILSPIEASFMHKLEPQAITVIIRAYRAPSEVLRRQLRSLEQSHLKPYDVIVHQDGTLQSYEEMLSSEFPKVKHVHNRNHSTHGRGALTIAWLVRSEYTAVVEEGEIPGTNWLLYAMENVESQQAMVGVRGALIDAAVLDGVHTEMSSLSGGSIVPVDLLRGWWVWRTEWTASFFALERPSSSPIEYELAAHMQLMMGLRSVALHRGEAAYSSQVDSSCGEQKCGVASEDDHVKLLAAQYWIQRRWRTVAVSTFT